MTELDLHLPNAKTLPKKVDDPELESLRLSLSARLGAKTYNHDFDWNDCFARLAGLPKLSQLVLSECHLKALPAAVGQLRALRQLDLADNDLSSLPDELFDLELESLNLRGNPLEAIPTSLGNAKRLKQLEISGTRVRSSRCPAGPLHIPDSIGDLVGLEELDLTVNALTTLPPRFGELQALRRLDIGHNRCSIFPQPLATLSRLESLTLGGGIRQLDVDLGALTSLRSLNLGIVEDLPALQTLRALETLHLHVGTALPSALATFKTLRILSPWCDLAELPPDIGELVALEQLELMAKHLATLPAALAKLARLRRLDLRWLLLDTPPPVLANLPELDLLCLEKTRIAAWGETLRAWLPKAQLWHGAIADALLRRRIEQR